MREFYSGKTVLITGNTGFKGTWLTKILLQWGARIVGYALQPNTNPSLFEQLNLEDEITQIYADVRDLSSLMVVFEKYKPEIVFHLAAQPLVKESFQLPKDTYEINVMGTVNVLEACRLTNSVRSIVNVTTDKVYKNNEWEWGYRENDVLDGFDPYSNSKSCSELVSMTYIRSFFKEMKIPVSTMRAGNVIGGGDYSKDRIIPDAIRSFLSNQPLLIRNPNSTRPYQHVLEPLLAYLNIAWKQYFDYEYASFYNIGPDDKDCITTKQLIDYFNEALVNHKQNGIELNIQENKHSVHEANFLKLDCSKYRNTFTWKPGWSIKEAIEMVVSFALVPQNCRELHDEIDRQIITYIGAQNVE